MKGIKNQEEENYAIYMKSFKYQGGEGNYTINLHHLNDGE